MDSMTHDTRHTMIPTGLIMMRVIEAETTTIQACIHRGKLKKTAGCRFGLNCCFSDAQLVWMLWCKNVL